MPSEAVTTTRSVRLFCHVLVLAGIALLLWRVHPPRQDPRDFQSLYASAYCFAHHLSPYDTAQLDRVLVGQHVIASGDWNDNLPLYPPTALALFVPFTYLPIRVAAALWYALEMSSYIAAIIWVLFAQPAMRTVALPLRTAAAVLALLFPKAIWSLNFGNPALLATSLLAFAVFYPNHDKNQSLRVSQLVLFVFALLLKPQLAGPYLLLFCFRSRRRDLRKLLATLAALAIFTTSVLAYAAHYASTTTWRADIDRNLALGRRFGMSMDPAQRIRGGSTMLNLQYMFGYWLPAYSTSLAVSLIVGALLIAAFVVFAWRSRRQMIPGTDIYLLAAASLAPITLLLVYHRFYDAPLLLLALPWTLLHLRRRHWIAASASAALLIVLYKSWFRNLPMPSAFGILPTLRGFLYSRYESVALLLLAVILLSVLARTKSPLPFTVVDSSTPPLSSNSQPMRYREKLRTPVGMTRSFAHSCAPIVLSAAFVVAATAQAQFTPQNDPANLAGERVSPADPADSAPINHGALALQQLLRKLRTRASFMLIVAHPDDEDNGMLTYLSRGKGARVATLTLNRGEGGQNLMSADFGDALGLIRTQELLLSDRYMGADQFFGTEVDFGFSKTKEEAFAKWSHDRVLYDAVRAIRLYRPLVIASVFIGEPSDGHGQHQVAGQIAQEAFKAAGDPSVFPDQVAAGLLPWQPLKVYARSPFGRIDDKGMYDYATTQYVPARFENYVTGKVTTTVPKANVVVPEGETDLLLGGESYAQYGREARSLQRSQIGGGSRGEGPRGGRVDVSYHRYGSMLHQPDGDESGLESSFFEGIDTSLPGTATLAPEISDKLRPGLQRIDDALAKAQHDFDPARPDAIAPILHDSLASLDKLIAELQNPAVNDLPRGETFNLLHELKIKRVQLNNALVLAHGVSLTATTPSADADGNIRSTEKTITVKLEAANNSDDDAAIASLSLDAAGTRISTDEQRTLTARSTWRGDRTIDSSGAYPPTRPYFSRPNIQQPFYDVSDPALRNAPQTPSALTVNATLDCGGVPLQLAAVVSNEKKTHPAAFVPPVSVSVATGENRTRTRVLPNNQQSFSVALTKRPADAPTRNEALLPSDGWKTKLSQAATEPGEFQFQVTAPAVPRSPATLTGSVQTTDGKPYTEGYRPIGYFGLPGINYYTPATLRVVPVDVRTAPNLNIAYVPGTGDDIPTGLDQLGIHPHILTIADLTTGKLSQYDAIILGVRAYAAHPELAGKGSAPLIDYARNGGVVIAQYNNARYGKDEAPFPITVAASSGDHAHDVVDETAPVTILAPDSPILTWPNRITTADFSGWVEERGHSFAASWAPEYQPLLSTHDPGQEPQHGGLLVAHTGKGLYIYLGLALYRQLPEGVPGSYRLLANLISAAKNPQFTSAR